MTTVATNLLDLDGDALTAWFAARGDKPFRAKQVQKWLHQRQVGSFGEMTDLAKTLRATLETEAAIVAPQVIKDHVARDGTRKWLFDVGQRNAVEAVFIPEDDRGTLCISSQAGCAVDCTFCSTGKQGFSRNLTTAEIIGQLWLANKLLKTTAPQAHEVADSSSPERRPITNVVMMGMGEPLLNFDRVVPALKLMLDDNAYGLSRRRVTLSTSGVVPMMDRLRTACPVALAVSLHAPTDALRDELVPLNRKYPLAELMAACKRYLDVAPRDFVTFEYVMLDGINDSLADAEKLVTLVRSHNVACKFNLIPYNPFPGTDYRASSRNRLIAFVKLLQSAGLVATIRKTRGDDIDAACGQLAGEVQDRTKRNERVVQLHRSMKHAVPDALAA